MMTSLEPAAEADAVALGRLQKEHGHRYWIVRTPSMWIATARVDDGTEPTIIRETPEDLAHAMAHPEPRVGRWEPLR